MSFADGGCAGVFREVSGGNIELQTGLSYHFIRNIRDLINKLLTYTIPKYICAWHIATKAATNRGLSCTGSLDVPFGNMFLLTRGAVQICILVGRYRHSEMFWRHNR